MLQLRRLIHEIHRRSLWQVLGVYGIASWIIYQVVLALYEGIGLPQWVPGTALVLLLVGLPIVLATAFVQEGAPAFGGTERRPTLEGLETTSAPVTHARPTDTGAEAVDPGSPVPHDPSSAAAGRGSLLTWPRAITGGVLAFALLGVAATGFMGMRALGIGPAGTLIARGELETNARILIADFDSSVGDSSIALAVTEALRIDLPQSDVLRVVDQGEVAPGLGRMGLDATTRLSEPVARELAVREGIETVLLGDVQPLGTTIQLTARLVSANDGTTLLQVREVADGPDEIVDAVDRLSERIRERAGESLKSIRASEPLLRATTGSLEALQLYSRAQRMAVIEGDNDRAASLLEQALALDSTFAMAWRKYGVVLTNDGRPRAESVRAFTQAMRFADRLPAAERYMTIAAYYSNVEYDPDRVIAAYEDMIDQGLAYWGVYNNLSFLYHGIGEFEKAMEMADSAAALNPTALALQRQIVQHVSAGDLEGAERALERRMELYPDHPTNDYYQTRLLYYRGHRDSIRSLAEQAVAERRGDDRLGPLSVLSDLDEMEGKIRSARERQERAIRMQREAGDHAAVLATRLEQVVMDELVLGDRDAARGRLAAALAEAPLDSIPPLDRPYLTLAAYRAILGDPVEARRLLEEREREVPAGLRQRTEDHANTSTRGRIALAEGRVEEALELLREATRGTWATHTATINLAWAYDLTGRADSALAAYRRYDEMQHFSRIATDDLWLPLALERLGQLHEERGDRAEAARYYARFAELWEEADPELQPRVEAARRALARLTGEAGG